MGEITRRISFGMGVPAAERSDHAVLDRIRNAEFAPQRKLAQLAESQLGTVGSGNHYVNVMADEDDRVWVGVHFGSRGFGHKTASGFLALAQGLPVRRARRTTARWTRRRCCSRSTRSSAGRTSRRWSWRASTRTPAATSSSRRCWRSSARTPCTRCTTTTTSRGSSRTTAATTGSSARAARRRGRARRASSAARWATTRSSSRASRARTRPTRCSRRCTAPAA